MKRMNHNLGKAWSAAALAVALFLQTATAGEMASQKWVTTRIAQQETNTQAWVNGKISASEANTDAKIASSESRLDAKIDDEIQTVNASVEAKVSGEQTRAQAAESANATAIVVESTRAKSAESANATSIAAEKSRAEAVEAGINNRVSAVETSIVPIQSDVANIKVKIPAAATAANQLADKAYVTDAVRQNASTFRGSFASWTAVPSAGSSYQGGTPTKNDYITIQDASDYGASYSGTWLFRYSGASWESVGKAGWSPEYKISTEAMTAPQLAAINSGITADKVLQIGTNTTELAKVDPKIAAAIQAMEVFTTNAIAKSSASLSMGSQTLVSNDVYYATVGSGLGQAAVVVENKTVSALTVSNATSSATALGVTNGMLMVWDGSTRYFNKDGHAVYCTPSNFLWRGMNSYVTNGVDYFQGYFYVRGTKIQPTVAAAITNGVSSRTLRMARASRRDSSNPSYQPSGWDNSASSSVGTYWSYDADGNLKYYTVSIGNDGKISGLPESYTETAEGMAAKEALENALQAKEMVKELSENVVTDLKWDSNSKKLTWTKKSGTSSGSSENSATLEYKLNKDSNDFWLQINGAVAGDKVARAKGDNQTIEFADSSTQKLRVKVKAEGGLESTSYGLAAKTYDNSGIKIIKNGIAVKVKDKGGILTDSNGVSVRLQNNSALYLGSTGLAVLTASSGGIEKKDNNGGLAIKVKDKKGIARDTDGIYVDVDSEGGINYTATGALEINVDPEGGLLSSDDGLAVYMDEKTITLDDSSALSVNVGDGLKVDGGFAGIQVNAGDGLQIDDEKVAVKGKSDGCITVDSDGVDVKVADDGALSTDGGLAVKVGSSITTDNNALVVKCDPQGAMTDNGNGIDVSTDEESITVENTFLTVKVYDAGGIKKSSDGLELNVAENSGLMVGSSGLTTLEKNGIVVDGDGNLTIQPKSNGGIGTDNDGVYVINGSGIKTDGNGVSVKLAANSGMEVGDNGIKLASVGNLCGWNGASWVQIQQSGGGVAVDDKSICSNSEQKLSIKGWDSQGACEAKMHDMLMNDNDPNRSTHLFLARVNGSDLHYVPMGDSIKGDDKSIAKDNDNKIVLKGASGNNDKLLCSGGSGDNQWLTIGDGLEKDGSTLKSTGAGDDHSITVVDKKSVIKGAAGNADKLLQSGGSGDNKWLEIGDGLQVDGGVLKSSAAGDDHSITVDTEQKAVIKGAAGNADKLLQSGGSGDNKWVTVSEGLEIDSSSNIKVLADPDGPVNVTSDGVSVLCDEETITVDGNELTVSLDPEGGIYSGDTGIGVDCGDGIDCDSDGVKVKLASNSGLEVDSNGLKLDIGSSDTILKSTGSSVTWIAPTEITFVSNVEWDSGTHQLKMTKTTINVYVKGDATTSTATILTAASHKDEHTSDAE